MRRFVIIGIVLLFVFSAFVLASPSRAVDSDTTHSTLVVRTAFGDSDLVFGARIGMTNATYLGSLSINETEVAFYKLNPGEHYVTNNPPSEHSLNWSEIKTLSQISIENFDVAPGNNYESKPFGAATRVFSRNEDIEGMEIVGNYVYITYRNSSQNLEMRYLSNFTLVKSLSLGNSTYDHCGGIVYDGKGHLWTVLSKPYNSGPSYIYEFDLNLNEIQQFITDDDHYGTVFYADNRVVIVGNWNSQQMAEFNATSHSLMWKENAPLAFQYTQDSAYLGGGYYLGARYRNDFNYSGIYLYHWNGSGLVFDTNLIAYMLNGTNPIAIDENGYVYADTEENTVYKTKDVFLPLIYANITSGDKYNIGFSNIWPCQDSGYEEYIFGGTESDLAVGFEIHTGEIERTTVIFGDTTGVFKQAYYGTYTDLNGNLVKGGLPTDVNLKEFAVQTWNSANQNLQGSAYMTKAVPYAILSLPSAPMNLSAKSGNKYVNLTWNKPADAGSYPISSYKIYRNGTVIATVPATQRWYNDSAVRNGQNYTYYVTAVNFVGEGDKSNTVKATPKTVPEAPQNLKAAFGDCYVNLTWEAPKDNGGATITTYKVYRDEKLVASVPASNLWYNDTDVSLGHNYTYYVTAVNSVGEGNKSNEVKVTPISVPSAPQNIKARAGDDFVNLTWTAPADNGGAAITEYKIYRNGRPIMSVSATQPWFNDTDVKNGVTYSYYVTAVNTVGESEKSAVVNATPMSVPGAPQNIKVAVGRDYVNLTWTAPRDNGGANITMYRIYRDGLLIANVSANQTWFNDTHVKENVNYTYYVTAVNAMGEGAHSKNITVRISVKHRGSIIHSGSLGIPLLWIVVILIAIALVAVAIIYVRKQQGEEPLQQEPEQEEIQEEQ